MSKLAVQILEKLARKADQPEGLLTEINVPISPSRFQQYHSCSQSEREEVHSHLGLLEWSESWISLVFRPRAFGDLPLIDRIKVTDTHALLNYLGISSSLAVIAQALAKVEAFEVEEGVPAKLSALLDKQKKRWGEGQAIWGCKASEPEKLIKCLQAVCAILDMAERGIAIDYRTLSVRLYSDSKTLEGLVPTIEQIMKGLTPDGVYEKRGDILRFWGVSRFPMSIRIKGPVKLETRAGLVDLACAWPFIEIPPDGIKKLYSETPPTYVIFVENKTSFERYCREIEDGAVVIYTNGFPPTSWQRVFKSYVERLPAHTLVFHWGDIDEGGYRIFRFMTELLNRNVIPHMMDILKPPSDEGGGKKVALSGLKMALNGCETTGASLLLKEVGSLQASGKFVQWIEQESIEVKPPIYRTTQS